MLDDAIRAALKSSQAEQLPVMLHVHGTVIPGVVARIEDLTVELRSAAGRSRTIVRIDRIDAVVLN